MARRRSAVLADEMGLGKTVQAVTFVNYLFKTYNLRGPYLVVAERSRLSVYAAAASAQQTTCALSPRPWVGSAAEYPCGRSVPLGPPRVAVCP
jgi:hypothetical protein